MADQHPTPSSQLEKIAQEKFFHLFRSVFGANLIEVVDPHFIFLPGWSTITDTHVVFVHQGTNFFLYYAARDTPWSQPYGFHLTSEHGSEERFFPVEHMFFFWQKYHHTLEDFNHAIDELSRASGY